MSQHAPSKEIVVIGAGIVGASIAFRLAQRGAAVTVVDAGEPGQGASAVSFAWINARDKNPRAYHDLNRRSLDMWDRFARELGTDVGLTWGGELRWAATAEGAHPLAERVRTLQSWGYPIALLDEMQVRRMEPRLETGPVSAASYSRADGHVNTAPVIAVCLERATALKAEVYAGRRVTGFELTQGAGETREVAALTTSHGTLPCDAVVLAAGPDGAELAALAGIDLPLRSTFGATVITERLPPVFAQAAVVQTAADAEPPVSFRQLPDGSMMLHGGDGATESGSVGRTNDEARQLLVAAARFVPSLAGAAIKEVRRGRRPIPADGHPVLGFTAAVPNLYLATMHSSVTLSPLVSEFAAIEILDGARIDILEPYRVERFVNNGD
jgi:glycine/D-amino acid oxidase-like deaminating enzyme